MESDSGLTSALFLPAYLLLACYLHGSCICWTVAFIWFLYTICAVALFILYEGHPLVSFPIILRIYLLATLYYCGHGYHGFMPGWNTREKKERQRIATGKEALQLIPIVICMCISFTLLLFCHPVGSPFLTTCIRFGPSLAATWRAVAVFACCFAVSRCRHHCLSLPACYHTIERGSYPEQYKHGRVFRFIV